MTKKHSTSDAQLRLDYEMLDSIISTSSEGLWCIEFVEPVDLTAPEEEVIRQVLNNSCFWRVMNPAMQDFYKMPIGMDVRKENVRFIFPESAENAEFVRKLYRNNFHVDKALSRDQMYDGTWINVENDVRGYIRDDRLLMMWGTIRKVEPKKTSEKNLAAELEQTNAILSALPDPVIVLDTSGSVAAANPAVEWRFGWMVEDILGEPVSALIDDKGHAAIMASLDIPDRDIDVDVRTSDGSVKRCVCRVGREGLQHGSLLAVLSLRPAELQKSVMDKHAERLSLREARNAVL